MSKMNINEIKPNPNNPRKINSDDFAKLRKSISDDPSLLQAKPLILDENNVILGGNQRYRVCLELGIQDVPVIVMRDLTEYKAVEHLTPLSIGGDNQNWNLVYSCQRCNARKRTKTLEEYAIKHELYHLITKFDIIYASAIS